MTTGRRVERVAPILPPGCLGVIGGGQLGRMFVQAAQRMGYRTLVLSATDDAPAAQIADEVAVGPPGDRRALEHLAARAQAVTVEFENVSAPALRWLDRRIPVRPGWRTVWISQNRLREKRFLSEHGIPTAPWCPVRDEAELGRAVASLGVPLILKTAASGYDGKGQIRVNAPEEAEPAWASLNRVPCVAEGLVSFERELSVLVARGLDGEVVSYPPAWNVHTRHILDTTVMPAPLEKGISDQARGVATQVSESLGAVGVLCVEMFLAEGSCLLVNEIAPRPHNSGHLTIEAAETSQFEQQVRTLCGLKLGPTGLIRPAAMANLLGDLWQGGEPAWDCALEREPALKLHLYGKRNALPGRKMGHMTLLGDNPGDTLDRLSIARESVVRREGG